MIFRKVFNIGSTATNDGCGAVDSNGVRGSYQMNCCSQWAVIFMIVPKRLQIFFRSNFLCKNFGMIYWWGMKYIYWNPRTCILRLRPTSPCRSRCITFPGLLLWKDLNLGHFCTNCLHFLLLEGWFLFFSSKARPPSERYYLPWKVICNLSYMNVIPSDCHQFLPTAH